MKRLKAFYYVYKNSLYNISYYKDVIKVKRRFSLKYFLVLAFFATVITTARVTIPLVPKVQMGLDNLLYELSMSYPRNLEITAENGEWSINQPEPYAIKTPDFFVSDKEGNFPENFIVFDHNGTINDLKDKHTLILVNGSNLITLNGQNRLEAYPLDNIPNGEINHQKFNSSLENVREYLGVVPAIIVIFVLLGTLFYFTAFRLAYLFVVALILMAAGNIKGLKYGMSDYYKMGLHSITLPITLELAFTLLGTNSVFPFAFFILNLIFGISVVFYLADSKQKS